MNGIGKTLSALSLPNHRQRLFPFVPGLPKQERALRVASGFFNPLVLSLPNPRQRLSPFVLSLSKYERALQAVNTLSNPDSFFELFFNPYPSTRSGQAG
ncbi:MAG: hypothetical protein LBD67_06545 [Candidatus Accumulibacter sp.]|nr:hypothetical protein [Accumulibacter sp.]